MKRAIVVVIDGLGVAALPDAENYGDTRECNTLSNVARHIGGLELPNLQKLGLGNIVPVAGVAPVARPTASYGRMMEVSEGKDSTTGHWELAGFVLDKPFRVYPNGFPRELLDRFVLENGCGGYLGNCSASGTEIIARFHEEHTKTGKPIVYTSADSVFQVACNVNVVPLEKLYAWCKTVRAMLTEQYNVSRVIARPYRDTENGLKRMSSDRRDFAVKPWKPTVLNRIIEHGGRVLGIGKIADIFVESGVSHAVHTKDNVQGLELTTAALDRELDLGKLVVNDTGSDACCELIFTNLVDTDSLYGHRRDPDGYGHALEQIDRHVPLLVERIRPDDLLIITSDHGCDPTAAGSDHTREYVPLLVYAPATQPCDLGTRGSFTYVAEIVSDWLGISDAPTPRSVGAS